MTCPQCGNTLNSGAAFCGGRGAAIKFLAAKAVGVRPAVR